MGSVLITGLEGITKALGGNQGAGGGLYVSSRGDFVCHGGTHPYPLNL